MPNQRPYSVYVLWSDAGNRFYTGVTEDVAQRLEQHNTAVSKWTKRYAGSWQLVWQEQFPSLGEARKFENRLKKQRGGKGFFTLTGLCPEDFRSSGS